MFENITVGGKFIFGRDLPTTVVLLGKEVQGYAEYSKAEKRMYRKSKDKGGKFNFAIQAWDGENVRILTGGFGLAKALAIANAKGDLAKSWITIERPETGKYLVNVERAVDNTDMAEIEKAAKFNLADECEWADL
jgi:hypothetical protein